MSASKTKPIRWGMVGGGRGSQIGYIHRSAALRDSTFELVAGAFDIDPERGRAFGVDLGLDEARSYPEYAAMFAAEAERPDGIEAVSVATPNNPFCDLQGGPRTRTACRLRKAALLHRFGSARAEGAVAGAS
ncbi:hypothetical protein ACVJBD_005069 [Rhizobium mongolense]